MHAYMPIGMPPTTTGQNNKPDKVPPRTVVSNRPTQYVRRFSLYVYVLTIVAVDRSRLEGTSHVAAVYKTLANAIASATGPWRRTREDPSDRRWETAAHFGDSHFFRIDRVAMSRGERSTPPRPPE